MCPPFMSAAQMPAQCGLLSGSPGAPLLAWCEGESTPLAHGCEHQPPAPQPPDGHGPGTAGQTPGVINKLKPATERCFVLPRSTFTSVKTRGPGQTSEMAALRGPARCWSRGHWPLPHSPLPLLPSWVSCSPVPLSKPGGTLPQRMQALAAGWGLLGKEIQGPGTGTGSGRPGPGSGNLIRPINTLPPWEGLSF